MLGTDNMHISHTLLKFILTKIYRKYNCSIVDQTCVAIGSCNEIVTIYFRNVTLYQVESYKNLRNKYNHFQNCNVGSANKRCIIMGPESQVIEIV